MGVVFGRSHSIYFTHIPPFNLTMRWSPFAAISTILAVTSIFEGVLSAPLDLLEVRAGVRQSIEKRNPPKVTLGPKGES
jgi:hypothetical protein